MSDTAIPAPPITSTSKLRKLITATGIGQQSSSVRHRARELSWVVSGKLTLMGANAVLMLLLAQIMELKLYGVLVTVISGQLLLSNFLLLGINAGMIRLRTLPDLRERSDEVVRAGLSVILYATAGAALIFLVIWFISFWVPMLRWPLWVVGPIFVGAVGTALVDYNYSYRLSELKYRAAGLLQSGTGIARLIFTVGTAMLLPAHPIFVFLAYPAMSLLSGSIATVSIPRESWLRSDFAVLKRLLRFSLWIGASNATIILSLYLGTFVLMLLRQEAETGVFGLCLTLSLGFFALYNAFGEYLLPRITQLDKPSELPKFLARSLAGALVIVVSCLPLILAIGIIAPQLLKPELHSMSSTFYLLAASMLVLIMQGSLECACIYLLRPHLMLIGWLARVLCALIVGLTLAPQSGALGMAAAQLIAAVMTLFLFAVFVVFTIRAQSKTIAY